MRNDADDSIQTSGIDCRDDSALPWLTDLARPLLSALATPRVAASAPERVAPQPPEPVPHPTSLFSVIETNIIPRLMLLHRRPERPTRAGSERRDREEAGVMLDPSDHSRFLETLRFGSEPALLEHVRDLLARGVPRPVVFVELLGQAARTLGELWQRDECSFADVTIGLCRLHMVIREESTLFAARSDSVHAQRHVLLATAAGDQHILGAVLVAEFFRREGWQVACEPGSAVDSIAGLLGRRRFDILGLSLSCESRAEEMRSEIETYRKASTNPGLGILVGGAVFEREPQLVEWLGADGVCLDARDAPGVALSVVARRKSARTRVDLGPGA